MSTELETSYGGVVLRGDDLLVITPTGKRVTGLPKGGMEAGETQIHLMWVDEPVALPRGHVAVVAEAYDDVVEALRVAGHEVEPRREHWGAPRAYVRDPAGNLVEVMAWAPGG